MRVLLGATLVLFAAASARADTLLLQDGRVLTGPRVEETADGVTVHFENGDVRIPTRDVLARFDADDPTASTHVEDIRRHRWWRARRRETRSEFTFETTLPPHVFRVYRDRMLRYFAALLHELGVENPESEAPKVCVYTGSTDFQQIGGVSSGTLGYYRHVPPRELAFFDEHGRRETCLRAMQWVTASYVVSLAFPGLPHDHPLHTALVDFYAAAVPGREPEVFSFGIASGKHWEILRTNVTPETQVGFARLTEAPRRAGPAWAWSLVHFLLQDEAYARPFVAHLKTVSATNDLDLEQALGLAAPEDVEAFENAWRTHILALQPTTAVDYLAAATVAEYENDLARTEALCRKAAALPSHGTEALRSVARAVERRGRNEAAVTAWQAVVDADPLDAEARTRLAACAKGSGDGAKAARQIALAHEIDAALDKR